MKKFVLLLILCTGLAACNSEEEAVDGRWVGTISAEDRVDLRIEGQRPDDQFVVIFKPGQVRLNDTVRPVEYLSNNGRTIVHFKDENRALTVYHEEEDPKTIELNAVSYYRGKVHRFTLHRAPDEQ